MLDSCYTTRKCHHEAQAPLHSQWYGACQNHFAPAPAPPSPLYDYDHNHSHMTGTLEDQQKKGAAKMECLGDSSNQAQSVPPVPSIRRQFCSAATRETSDAPASRL
jgi:hypothetical protein